MTNIKLKVFVSIGLKNDWEIAFEKEEKISFTNAVKGKVAKNNPICTWMEGAFICLFVCLGDIQTPVPGNTKGGSITVPLTSCLTGLESTV
jgi:hypothetical protein